MKTSQTIEKISPDVIKAHAEMKEVKKNAENPFTKSEYADLEAVLKVIRPILAKNKLALIQFPSFEGENVGVVSRLLHESGEWFEETTSVGKLIADPQKVGSAITYLRRYSAMAICGIAPEDDDASQSEFAKKNKKKTGLPGGAQSEKSMEAVVRGMPIKITAKFQRLKISDWTERYRLYKSCGGDVEKLSSLLDKKMQEEG